MLSTTSMTEERTAASAFGALAFGGFATASHDLVQSMAYGAGDVCASAIRGAHGLTPATKAWDARPLIPDGSGGG